MFASHGQPVGSNAFELAAWLPKASDEGVNGMLRPQTNSSSSTNDRSMLGTTTSALCALLVSGVACAQTASSAPAGDQSLSDRLDLLERDNAALRSEVTALRAESDQVWLTEDRAGEIRGLVQDVLADSSTRASFQDAAAVAGWDTNRGFYLRSADNRFSLELSGLVQARYTYSSTGEGGVLNQTANGNGSPQVLPNSQYGFDLPHTQLVFKGHVFEPGIRYFIRSEFTSQQQYRAGSIGNPTGTTAGSLNLLDAYMAFDLDNDWTVKAGQFKLPFSRERLVSVQNLVTATRSTVDELLSVGRSQGIQISTRGSDLYWAAAISNGGSDNVLAGVSGNSGVFPVGTEPLNQPFWNGENTFAITSRVEYKLAGAWAEFNEMTSPMGESEGILLGLAGHYQTSAYDPTGATQGTGNNQWLSLTADATWNFGGASLFASAYYTNTETKWSSATPAPPNPITGTTNMVGVMVQGSMYLTPKWEVFGSYQYLDQGNTPRTPAGDNLPASSVSIFTVGANWYIDGQDIRWNVQMGYSFNQITPYTATLDNGFRPTASDYELVLMTQLQLQF